MELQDKNRFDALAAMRDHAWKEFESKSMAEWRLSLGLWAALLAASATLVSEDRTIAAGGVIKMTIVVGIVAAHALFLVWIQLKLRECRKFIHEAQLSMRSMLQLQESQEDTSWRRWVQPSPVVQGAITVIVSYVFILVLFRE